MMKQTHQETTALKRFFFLIVLKRIRKAMQYRVTWGGTMFVKEAKKVREMHGIYLYFGGRNEGAKLVRLQSLRIG